MAVLEVMIARPMRLVFYVYLFVHQIIMKYGLDLFFEHYPIIMKKYGLDLLCEYYPNGVEKKINKWMCADFQRTLFRRTRPR